LRLAELLGAEAAEIIIPGGKLTSKAIGVLAGHMSGYVAARRQARLEAFHERLLEGADPALVGQMQFDADEYYAILASVLADEEEEKIGIYALLMRYLVDASDERRLRVHLLKSFRSLAAGDFDLLERICAATRAEEQEPDSRSPSNRIRHLLPEADSLARASVENLVYWGYLEERTRSHPWPTPLATTVAKALKFAEPRRQ
jgi:hypothetical protein